MLIPSPATLPLRRLTRRDLTACADLSEDRGWSREEYKWRFLLTVGRGYGIDDPDGGGLIAACVVTEYGTGERTALGAVGMVLVADRYARRGIGRRLMEQVVTDAGGTPLTLYATPNGRPLYEKLGFGVVGRAEMLQGRFVPEEHGSAVRTRAATAEDLSSVLRLDAEVFGTDRTSLLVRLPSFADLFRVAEADGRITGYAAAWPNMDTHVVGPLIARDTGTAKALVASLAAGTDRPLRTDVDVRHAELLGWLKERGVARIHATDIMVHGAPDLPGDWRRRFAPLTVAAG
ncbi:GNAT family N-acetyltransferase [Streptomyces sp. J2-1]|uniref:GNAT family N-acetyltransferase n=1 Tax=Streptomyces corallincola TaxID=2851888 RepID=UPI001C385C55|nr:GNAT family N-acetyltransferase [Streptomyces corallincola]MBV2354809.1 GNAT family N-acetyltransferase [Streptomyces corallincola]